MVEDGPMLAEKITMQNDRAKSNDKGKKGGKTTTTPTLGGRGSQKNKQQQQQQPKQQQWQPYKYRGKGGKGNAKGGRGAVRTILYRPYRRDPEYLWRSTLARALAFGKQYPFAGLPRHTYDWTAADYFDGSKWDDYRFLSERTPVRYITAKGKAQKILNISLAQESDDVPAGRRLVLVYALPDMDEAFAVFVCGVKDLSKATYWPSAVDYDKTFGANVWSGGADFTTTNYTTTHKGSTLEVVSYHTTNNPFADVDTILEYTDSNNCGYSKNLSCLGEAHLTVTVHNTDSEVVTLFETTPAVCATSQWSPDGSRIRWVASERSVTLAGKNYTQTVYTPTTKMQFNGSIVASNRRHKGAAASTHSGDWQPWFSGPAKFTKAISAIPNTTTNNPQKVFEGWLSSGDAGYGVHIPDPYRSRGCWVALNVAGPADKTVTIRIDYSDWYGHIKTLTDGYQQDTATLASMYEYPPWFNKVNASGVVSNDGQKAFDYATAVRSTAVVDSAPEHFELDHVQASRHVVAEATANRESKVPITERALNKAKQIRQGMENVVETGNALVDTYQMGKDTYKTTKTMFQKAEARVSKYIGKFGRAAEIVAPLAIMAA